jgi:hypothetical protein
VQLHERKGGPVVAAEDIELASQFRTALETAVRTGDPEPVLELVAADVEWITPQRTLRGSHELRSSLVTGSSAEGLAEAFDFEFAEDEWVDHGDGRVACDVKQVYRMKDTGEFAYERIRRVELTIHDRKISRYELHFSG